jgi:hypothetical protein
MSKTKLKKGLPMNVFVGKSSRAETRFRNSAGLPIDPQALAPGLPATPEHNLINHGGKTIHDLNFSNFYIGGATSWNQDDIKSIDKSLAAAMSDRPLNNVMTQYFGDDNISSVFNGSKILDGNPPTDYFQSDVEKLVTDLFSQGKLDESDLKNAVFNFMLPKGTILHTGVSNGNGGARLVKSSAKAGFPEREEDDSTHGLGGYHGSVHSGNATLYYAVGVYSEGQNGIPVFNQPWKNVVATFYHELNEARTDANVEDVINSGNNDPQTLKLLGWTSAEGEECGDFPVFEANPLTQVFKEVAAGNLTVPIQFQYSNAVNGPEGPIDRPHPRP